MKYLFLLNDAADGPPEDPASPEYAEMYAQYGKALTAMREAGRADRLRRRCAGTRRPPRSGSATGRRS